MHRYATAPRATFEELFAEARYGTVLLEAAEYPPVCTRRGGTVELALGPTGAMIVHVQRGACGAEDFRLRLLFETGTCIFPSPDDLCGFWTGPLAAAFGLEPSGPTGPPAEEPGGDGPDAAAAAPAAPGAGTPGEGSLLGDLAPRGAHGASRPDGCENATGPSPGAPAPRQALTAPRLAQELARTVHGQDAALERVASATVAQLAKRHPARPGSVLLIGPTGVGKTSTVEALPAALEAIGVAGARVFRLDCGDLTDSIQVTRLLGAPPGYVGYAQTTPLLTALAQPRRILLVDEVEKAHPEVLDLLLGLLDGGRLTGSAGTKVDARHVVVALTTSAESDELLLELARTPLGDRWAVQRACARHLRACGLPADLVGRIGAFAVFSELDGDASRRGVAQAAVEALAAEYGLVVAEIDPVVLDVVEDIARAGDEAAGARGLHHAARELLAQHFAAVAGDGPRRRVAIEAGPPLGVRAVEAGSHAGAS
jgi:hypothetical protein